MGSTTTIHLQGISRNRRMRPFFWIQIAAVAALIFGLYMNVMVDLAAEWWNVEASSYGMLIPPLALYIAYLQRKVTFSVPARPDARGLSLVVLGCLILLVGQLAAEFYLTRISIVPILAGLTWTFWGLARTKTLAFSFVLLGTMVPLPGIVYNTMAAPLQLFASTVSANLAQAMGVSIFRDGNVIHLAGTSLGIAEACSGLNSLSSLVVAALLLGFLEDASILGHILLMVLSIPLGIAVNVIRVTGTAVLADYHLAFALGFYHIFSGWLVFLLGFSMLWMLGKLVFRATRTAK
jgi:exosortase